MDLHLLLGQLLTECESASKFLIVVVEKLDSFCVVILSTFGSPSHWIVICGVLLTHASLHEVVFSQLLHLFALVDQKYSDDQYHTNEEVPDELGRNSLSLILTELSLEALSAETLAILTLASILANATASLACCLKRGKTVL